MYRFMEEIKKARVLIGQQNRPAAEEKKMRILVVSDVESKSLWDYYDESKLKGIDLILSCGDVSHRYLSFLVTFANVPLLYVYGNHDTEEPEGCTCIEDQIYLYRGLRILGLGGSMRYRPGPHQYSESQMRRRIALLWWQLKKNKGFDILLTHAPAYKLGDGDDLCHTGSQCFFDLMDKYKPKYFIHGHMHLNYGGRAKRLQQYKETIVINGYEAYIIDVDVQNGDLK